MPSLCNKPLLLCLAALLGLALPFRIAAQAKPAGAPTEASVVKSVGTIKSVQPDSITISAESGGEVTAKLASSTKILRVPPGEKDLKNATALQPQDLQPGDRVLVRGQASPDTHTIAALAVIVMKQADVSAKQQREREDWQKRGVDGLVSKVDTAAGSVTISSGGLGASHDIAVQVNKDTILRRYAPGSTKFEDAKPAPLDQIKVGDQLRARGTRSPESKELTAEEIVSGTFRNIAGAITAIDASNNSVTVQDRIAKGAVVVKISSDSQVKKLPAEMAQRIAMRLKGEANANGDHGPGSVQNASAQNAPSGGAEGHRWPQQPGSRGTDGARGAGAGGAAEGRPGGAPGGNGPPDFQRLLSRLPNTALTDLQKGEVVMVLSTEGKDSSAATAITLLAGVEPILTTAPSRAVSSLLSPWTLSTTAAESEGGP